MRTRMGKAQYLLGAKGKATCKEKTTKLWPKAKKGCFWEERRGSWCMPAPQMSRPDLRARVSSTAATDPQRRARSEVVVGPHAGVDFSGQCDRQRDSRSSAAPLPHHQHQGRKLPAEGQTQGRCVD